MDHLRLLSQGPTCTQGKMVDTLSDYVNFDELNYNVVVKAYKGGKDQDKTGITIFESNQLVDGVFSNSVSNYDKLELIGIDNKKISVKDTIKPKVSIFGKTITLEFNPGWKMDPSYLYELSFNVYANKKAYELESDQSGYNEIGNLGTGVTSENRDGIFLTIVDILVFIMTAKNTKRRIMNYRIVIRLFKLFVRI